jgi:hypothetical protein
MLKFLKWLPDWTVPYTEEFQLGKTIFSADAPLYAFHFEMWSAPSCIP